MKKCSKCQESKPLSEYAINRARKDGHQTWCRDCGHRRYVTGRYATGTAPRPRPVGRYVLDEQKLRRLREAVGLDPDGPTPADQRRWHEKEMQG